VCFRLSLSLSCSSEWWPRNNPWSCGSDFIWRALVMAYALGINFSLFQLWFTWSPPPVYWLMWLWTKYVKFGENLSILRDLGHIIHLDSSQSVLRCDRMGYSNDWQIRQISTLSETRTILIPWQMPVCCCQTHLGTIAPRGVGSRFRHLNDGVRQSWCNLPNC
jgi:hypothetical protein